MRDHFLEYGPFDRFIRQSRIVPPPAVLLHGFRGGYEAIGNRGEIGVRIVEAEDQPAGTDPAQRQAFGAQIILQHPIVTGRLRVTDRPNRGHVLDLDRQRFLPQSLVQLSCSFIPSLIEIAVKCFDVRRLEMAQEFVHRRHDVGMRIERAAGKADVGRAVIAETPHQIPAPAYDADREPAAKCLAVSDQIGADAEIFLGAAFGKAKTEEDLVENENDVLLAADRRQALEPIRISRLIEVGVPCAVDERGVRPAPTRSGAIPAAD